MRVVLTHSFTLDVLPAEALDLFTPEGERTWVSGWNPAYPAGEPSDTVGTIFQTEHNGHSTIWAVVDHGVSAMRYARVTPGHTAGIVAVSCQAAETSGTQVEVTYDLTALSQRGRDFLAEFAAGYEAYLEGWAADIARSRA